MKNYVFYRPDTGEIALSTSLPKWMPPRDISGLPFIETPSRTAPGEGWVRDGELVMYSSEAAGRYLSPPTRPASWSPKDGQWVDLSSLNDKIERAAADVDVERDRRIAAEIEYRGRMLDADSQAQENIRNKLAELDARIELNLEAPTDQLRWRDAANADVIFDTAADLRAWLLGLTVAISQRGTEIYILSWTVKARIRAAKTIQEIDLITW